MPEDVIDQMARTGIDASIAVQVRQSLEETRWPPPAGGREPVHRRSDRVGGISRQIT